MVTFVQREPLKKFQKSFFDAFLIEKKTAFQLTPLNPKAFLSWKTFFVLTLKTFSEKKAKTRLRIHTFLYAICFSFFNSVSALLNFFMN